jgi:hypothetical protein
MVSLGGSGPPLDRRCFLRNPFWPGFIAVTPAAALSFVVEVPPSHGLEIALSLSRQKDVIEETIRMFLQHYRRPRSKRTVMTAQPDAQGLLRGRCAAAAQHSSCSQVAVHTVVHSWSALGHFRWYRPVGGAAVNLNKRTLTPRAKRLFFV